jgi:hypothetical protein
MELKNIIKQTLKEFANIPSHTTYTQDKTIFDDEAGVYQWLSHGWLDSRRIFNVVLHIEIRGGFVWIERNASNIEIGEVLAERGIPKSQIVLGFQAPYKRGEHGYGIGETA